MQPWTNPFGTADEKKRLTKQSSLFCFGGILLFAGAFFVTGTLKPTSDLASFVFLGAVFLAIGLWTYGCMMYAKSKGQPSVLGLISFIGLIGLIILVVVEDRWKKALVWEASQGYAPPHLTNYPR